ncbi:hemerythrin domain-containing protein [Streptomyces sp. TRM68367]|uniref:hemerythrin domain-containing protein n=1 Tax=Streptomyces sp. TRM68367 TaxID=2758415 RepID=UPI00165C93E1|nr:hemerythrin domain-containing protein [Streptomyces sp. TRM68367]MBC9724214.1 hemerythrin domain-containing protein [Streptomyces sp. TRM68367]
MQDRANIITELTASHRRVEEALARVQSLPGDDPRRRDRLKEATLALVCQAVAQERHLHPAVRRYVPEGERLVRQEVTEELRMEEVLKDLEFTDTDSGEFAPLLRRLITRVHRHAVYEETAVFPELRRGARPKVLAALGKEVRRTEDNAAELRERLSHPPRPDLVDRARDAFEQSRPLPVPAEAGDL